MGLSEVNKKLRVKNKELKESIARYKYDIDNLSITNSIYLCKIEELKKINNELRKQNNELILKIKNIKETINSF